MPKARKLNLMVASTVYNFQDQLGQICATLKGYGYNVWNSHLGTIPQHPGLSNLKNCAAGAGDCDLFLGIIRPSYGSGVVGKRSITHEECRKAVNLKKPRWFLVHHDVVIARQLLKSHLYTKDGKRTKFILRENPVIDDVRVIDLYNDVIQQEIPLVDRKGHWAQEFSRIDEILTYIDAQLGDEKRIRRICKEMAKQ